MHPKKPKGNMDNTASLLTLAALAILAASCSSNSTQNRGSGGFRPSAGGASGRTTSSGGQAGTGGSAPGSGGKGSGGAASGGAAGSASGGAGKGGVGSIASGGAGGSSNGGGAGGSSNGGGAGGSSNGGGAGSIATGGAGGAGGRTNAGSGGSRSGGSGGGAAGTGAGGQQVGGSGGQGGGPADPLPPWPAVTPDSSFTANFIWQTSNGPTNCWLAFRKHVTLPSAPASAIADIAADSKYWLWINGRLAVFEGGLKRGPNQTDTYYDEIDLQPFLAAGDNTIAVLVWYWGKDGDSHQSSGKGGLLFQADIDGTRVVSDATWRVRAQSGYVPQTDPGPNFRLSEWNVQFDARRDLTGWMLPGYDDSAWATAIVKGPPPAAPWGHLWKRPIPQWRDFGLKDYVNSAQLPSVGTDGVVSAKLPYNAQVTPYLKVTAPAGAVIRIQTDTHGEGPSVRAEYTTLEGEQEYESFGWMSGNTVQYTIPSSVKIQALRYRETGFDTDFAGSFRSNDSNLNTLWTKALRTLYIDMRDNYMDCPTRERAQWWGDAVIEIGQTFYALDRRADLLSRKAISDLVEWRRSDGVLFSPIPGNWTSELPQQMLASIGRAGFWNYYLHTADDVAIRAIYPTVKKYFDLWQRSSDGLVQHRGSDPDWAYWADWGNNIDSTVLENVWYYMALDGTARMAEVAGQASDATAYRSRMTEFKTAFMAKFWNGSELRTPGRTGGIDERGHGLATVAGLLGSNEWPAVLKILKSVTEAGPYMEKYVLEAFFVMNDAKDGLARMRQRYSSMIQSQYSTLWEVWTPGDPGVPVEGGGTINHAWTGGPLTLLSQYVAGIAPTQPGYAEFQVMPQLGDLTQVAANVPSRKGSIAVDIKRGPPLAMEVTVPPATRATIGVPIDAVTNQGSAHLEVTIDGVVVFSAGTSKASTSVTFAGEASGYVKFVLGPGTHTFAAREL
jgi:alpha-L-rhamnosidase